MEGRHFMQSGSCGGSSLVPHGDVNMGHCRDTLGVTGRGFSLSLLARLVQRPQICAPQQQQEWARCIASARIGMRAHMHMLSRLCCCSSRGCRNAPQPRAFVWERAVTRL